MLKVIGNIDDLYKDVGDIENKEKVVEALQYHTVNTLSISKLNEAAKDGTLYLTSGVVPIDTPDPKFAESIAQYKIVPTYIPSKFNGNQVCASFYKEGSRWHGAYVGALCDILPKMQEQRTSATKSDKKKLLNFNKNIILKGHTLAEIKEFNKNTIQFIKYKANQIKEVAVTNNKEEIQSNIYTEIYSILLMKENWDEKGKLLENYLEMLLVKVKRDIDSSEDRMKDYSYVFSTDRKYVIVNTGLLDIFCKDIYIECTISDECLDIVKLVPSKASLIKDGFSKEDILQLPQPVRFYTDKGQLIFTGGIEDFDLEDISRFRHIVQERRNRFPQKYQDLSDDVLASKVITGIKRAVQISSRDYKYIIPMYDVQYDQLQFLVPLYLDNSVEDIPELALVIGESDGFYRLYTILDLNAAYMDARLISRPNSTWLRLE